MRALLHYCTEHSRLKARCSAAAASCTASSTVRQCKATLLKSTAYPADLSRNNLCETFGTPSSFWKAYLISAKTGFGSEEAIRAMCISDAHSACNSFQHAVPH